MTKNELRIPSDINIYERWLIKIWIMLNIISLDVRVFGLESFVDSCPVFSHVNSFSLRLLCNISDHLTKTKHLSNVKLNDKYIHSFFFVCGSHEFDNIYKYIQQMIFIIAIIRVYDTSFTQTNTRKCSRERK